MSQPNPDLQSIFNREYVELEEWMTLFASAGFPRLEAYLNERIKAKDQEIQRIAKEPASLDNSLKINIATSVKQELATVLEKFRIMIDKKKTADLRRSKEKANA